MSRLTTVRAFPVRRILPNRRSSSFRRSTKRLCGSSRHRPRCRAATRAGHLPRTPSSSSGDHSPSADPGRRAPRAGSIRRCPASIFLIAVSVLVLQKRDGDEQNPTIAWADLKVGPYARLQRRISGSAYGPASVSMRPRWPPVAPLQPCAARFHGGTPTRPRRGPRPTSRPTGCSECRSAAPRCRR